MYEGLKMKDVAPRLWKAHQQRKRELEARARVIAGMTQIGEGMARLHVASIPASQAFVQMKKAIDGLQGRPQGGT